MWVKYEKYVKCGNIVADGEIYPPPVESKCICMRKGLILSHLLKHLKSITFTTIVSSIVKLVLAATSVMQPTCIKQPLEDSPKQHFLLYLTCIKQPPVFSIHILSLLCVAASETSLTVYSIIMLSLSLNRDFQ